MLSLRKAIHFYNSDFLETEPSYQDDWANWHWKELGKLFLSLLMPPRLTCPYKFIEAATGYTGIVGHSLESYTTGVSVFKLSFPELVDSDICFIDTPGFDDTLKPDDVIFRQLSDWILSTYVLHSRVSVYKGSMQD